MTSKYTSENRRSVLPGFPKNEKFQSQEQLDEYFTQENIVCLQCGKEYRTLGVHLKTIHNIEPDEYRDIYGIPWTYGLSCAETRELHANDAKLKLETGIWKPPSAEQARLARNSANRRKRQPVSEMITARNLAIMNKDKTGKEAERRRNAPKRGTPEFKQMMRNRPVSEQTKEMLSGWWKDKEQTDEHVFKRTGYHKKNG